MTIKRAIRMGVYSDSRHNQCSCSASTRFDVGYGSSYIASLSLLQILRDILQMGDVSPRMETQVCSADSRILEVCIDSRLWHVANEDCGRVEHYIYAMPVDPVITLDCFSAKDFLGSCELERMSKKPRTLENPYK
jgi:hypothetical protein